MGSSILEAGGSGVSVIADVFWRRRVGLVVVEWRIGVCAFGLMNVDF
jgi:hypothetical protein